MFLCRITKIVERPDEDDGTKTFRVGIVGSDPFGSALDAAFAEGEVRGRSVTPPPVPTRPAAS